MAFDAEQLSQIHSSNGFGLYRYDTLDATTAIRASGYINNEDDDVNLRVGDLVIAYTWGTAIRTGTIDAYGFHVVLTVAADGTVDLSDALAGVVTNT